jgi:hypothetical protein
MARYLEGTEQQRNRAYSPAVITEGGPSGAPGARSPTSSP